MDKGIGFSRIITLDWLDVTASLCVQKIEPIEIRQRLTETIANSVQGAESQRKTIDVLSTIWVKSKTIAPDIRREALEIFPTLSSMEDRLMLHYGMTLVCYPFFRKCSAAIGQVSRTQDTITRKLIKDRIAGEYGHLGGLDRSVERILASLINWCVLENTKEKKVYQIQLKKYSSSEKLQSWLLTCALFAHPSDGLPFDDLIHLPELYPFNISIGADVLRKDARFEVQRQGGGLEMVRWVGN